MIKKLLFISSILFLVFNSNAQHPGSEKTTPILFESVVDTSQLFEEQELRQRMKADGLSDAVINKLIEDRKRLQEQGRTVIRHNHAKYGENPVPYVSCGDLGVENGWSQWSGVFGTNMGANPPIWGTPSNPPPTATANSNISITSGSGIDPCTPGAILGSPSVPIVCPGSGKKSIQLGMQQTAGAYAERATFPLTVTAADTNFIYSYALVFYDPGSSHAPNERPFAEFMILDQNADTVACSYSHYSYSSGDPSYFFANPSCMGGSSTVYKPWTSAGLNLVPYIGQTLTIVITNGDCVQGGHFAHSYWDFSCGPTIRKFCAGNPVTICAPVDTTNASSYSWSTNGIYLPNETNPCIAITPKNNDTLSLMVNLPSGCYYFVQYVMQDSCFTAIQENDLLQDLTIYPSPASKFIILDFTGKVYGEARLSISNLLGEIIYTTSVPFSGMQTMDVSGYADGIYFLKIDSASGKITRKIVVRH